MKYKKVLDNDAKEINGSGIFSVLGIFTLGYNLSTYTARQVVKEAENVASEALDELKTTQTPVIPVIQSFYQK